jgi:hypothetical protein
MVIQSTEAPFGTYDIGGVKYEQKPLDALRFLDVTEVFALVLDEQVSDDGAARIAATINGMATAGDPMRAIAGIIPVVVSLVRALKPDYVSRFVGTVLRPADGTPPNFPNNTEHGKFLLAKMKPSMVKEVIEDFFSLNLDEVKGLLPGLISDAISSLRKDSEGPAQTS